jgi:hypothetical protein
MSAIRTVLGRPPVGFVVEGRAEYDCYPSLVCRVLGASGFKVPRVNAGGYGTIVRHLPDQLRSLTLTDHPFHIIVTLDLRDVLENGLFADCGALCLDLRRQAREWLASAQRNARLHPLPELISIVVQVQQFESWVIADTQGLMQSGYLESEPPQCSNVDDTIENPAAWVRKHMVAGHNLKSPACARRAISCLDPGAMRQHSPSFDKFCRELSSSYSSWCAVCRVPPSLIPAS